VRVEPLRDVGAVGILVGQLADVEGLIEVELGGDAAEPFPHPLAAFRGMQAHGFRRDATAWGGQFGDPLEEPVLGVGGQLHQQALGEPRRRDAGVKTRLAQRFQPVET
jgi:hypothetical protein